MSGSQAKAPSPNKWVVYAALLSVSLVNTGYNVLTKQVLSAHGGSHDSEDDGSGSGSAAGTAPTKADPLIFSMLRDCTAFPILQLGAMIVDGAVLPRARDVPMIALFGLTGMFGNQFLFIYGLAGPKIPATEASVLSMTQPVFAAMLALLAGQQKPSWLLFFGVLFTFGGSIIMAKVWTVHHVFSDDAIRLGSLLLGALSMALYYVLQKPYLESYPLLSLTAWSYFFGAAWMVLAQCYYLFSDTPEKYHERWESVNNTDALLTLLFAVLMNSVAKYALQSFSNKWTNATTLCVWSCLVPIFTGLIGAASPESSGFHEPLTLAYLGAAPVIAGVMLVTMAKEKDKQKLRQSDLYAPIIVGQSAGSVQ